VQSQVRFNRVPEKVPEKVPEEVWEALVQSQVRFHGNPAEVFPALGFAARFRKICKNLTLRLPGIPPKLIHLLQHLFSYMFPAFHGCQWIRKL